MNRDTFSFALAALFVGALVLGCRAREGKPTSSTSESLGAVTEPPVAAPDGLMAEAVLTTPNATWTRVQRRIGGPAAILPSTFVSLVCSLASLDLAIADELDGAAPAYVAVAEDAAGIVSGVVGLRVRDVRHARSTLIESEHAKFAASEKTGMTLLAPKGQAGGPWGVALTRTGMLLFASNAAELERVGPFVHRTMAARAVPREALVIEVPQGALAGGVRRRLLSTWGDFKDDKTAQYERIRDAHGGKEPDFGDPPAILSAIGGLVNDAASFVADLENVRVGIQDSDSGLSVTVDAKPLVGTGTRGRAAAALDAMNPGDGAPVLALPRTSSIAYVSRDRASSRAETAKAIEAALVQAFGRRLPPEHAQRLHGALDRWTQARGDWAAASLSLSEPAGVGFRTPAVDAEAADRAVRDGLELLRLPAFREPLQSLAKIRDVTFGTDSGAGLPNVNVARFGRVAKPVSKRGAPSTKIEAVGIGWRAADGEVLVGAGERPGEQVARLHRPEGTLGDDPAIVEAVKGLGHHVTFALFAQPSRLGIARIDAHEAPVVVAWGKNDGHAWGHGEVGHGVLRELLLRLAGM